MVIVKRFGKEFESVPAKNFSYDVFLKPKSGIEITPLKFCEDNLFRCNVYRNKKIELVRKWFDDLFASKDKLFPEYKDYQDKIEKIDDELTAIFDDIKSQRSKERTKNKGSKEQQNKVKELRAIKKKLIEDRKIMNESIKGNAGLNAICEQLTIERKNKEKALSKEFNDLFWGFRGAIDQTVKYNKKPEFRRYDGGGSLVWQFQKQKNRKPLTFENTKCDTRIRIVEEVYNAPLFDLTVEAPIGPDNKKIKKIPIGSREKKYMVAHLETSGTTVKVPFIMDRPLPPDAEIKYCKLKRKRIGTTSKWTIVFTCTNKDGYDKPFIGKDECAIDVNWEVRPEGIAVAAVYGFVDGKENFEELIVPAEQVAYYKHTRSLQSICKDHFNKTKESLIQWKHDCELTNMTLPEWIDKDLEFVSKWESSKRLFKLTRYWTNNRFDGDDFMFNILRSWIRKYVHLYNWHVSSTQKFCAWRDDFYRNFASDLSKKYNSVRIENINIAEMKKNVDPTCDDKAGTRVNRDIVAPGRLLEIIKERFGEKIIKVEAAWSTKTCHNCGNITGITSEKSWTCEHCNKFWNRQYNAARNLLTRAKVIKDDKATSSM